MTSTDAVATPLSRRPAYEQAIRRIRARLRLAGASLIAVALVGPVGGAAQALERVEDPASPQEVLRDRRLAGIRDRVTIELAYAGGNLAGAQIEVEVAADGTVTLQGAVASDAARARAEQLAATQVGVKGVRNRLRVDPTLVEREAVGADGEDEQPEEPESVISNAGADAASSAEAAVDADAALSRAVAKALASALPFEARAEPEEAGGWIVDGVGWRFAVVARGGEVRLVGDVESVAAVAREVEAIERRPDVQSVVLDLEPADKGRWLDWFRF